MIIDRSKPIYGPEGYEQLASAIKTFQDSAEVMKRIGSPLWADDYMQIAAWLLELKNLREEQDRYFDNRKDDI